MSVKSEKGKYLCLMRELYFEEMMMSACARPTYSASSHRNNSPDFKQTQYYILFLKAVSMLRNEAANTNCSLWFDAY